MVGLVGKQGAPLLLKVWCCKIDPPHGRGCLATNMKGEHFGEFPVPPLLALGWMPFSQKRASFSMAAGQVNKETVRKKKGRPNCDHAWYIAGLGAFAQALPWFPLHGLLACCWSGAPKKPGLFAPMPASGNVSSALCPGGFSMFLTRFFSLP